jgi:carbon monoxide dehydrogenase subunit G
MEGRQQPRRSISVAHLRETIATSLPVEKAFAFVADFANASQWDPGVAWSERLDDGPLAVGARYRLGVRMAGRVAPMEYQVTHLEASRRVVLAGRGRGVAAVDDITFSPTETGSQVEYSADIRLTGLFRLLEPLAGGAFARLARHAREGMQRRLDELADDLEGSHPEDGASGQAA